MSDGGIPQREALLPCCHKFSGVRHQPVKNDCQIGTWSWGELEGPALGFGMGGEAVVFGTLLGENLQNRIFDPAAFPAALNSSRLGLPSCRQG